MRNKRRNLLKQHKKFQIKKEEDKLLINNKMKQSCNKKEKNRTNTYFLKGEKLGKK
jgi:hypothetical protein